LTIDHKAIDHFLFSYCIPQEYSIFREIKKVLPAHFIRFRKEGAKINKYWHLSFAEKEEMTEEEFIEESGKKLLSAVKRRMISDVPLGAFLSGGVDSSLLLP
jgi:asparagine synthase (glutamine-hydrolysing)